MKVITFSKTFPQGHASQGVPTFFVEKIWAWLMMQSGEDLMRQYLDNQYNSVHWNVNNVFMFAENMNTIKTTTIRRGYRWKQGDVFSPRIWSGAPYKSKQIEFAPPLEIVFIENTLIQDGEIFTDGVKVRPELVAQEDGLILLDFFSWLGYKPFEGQRIHFKLHMP